MGPPRIFTVGHSTRSLEELIAILGQAGIELLVDVRSVPRSRRHPQFERTALVESLPAHGIGYLHARELGGFRRPQADSKNGGWEQPAFRGYADYMDTEQFGSALDELQREARSRLSCVMCAEAQWWRCHRRLISDALVIRGWQVGHLGLREEPVPHGLTPFAIVGPGQTLTYPPAQLELSNQNEP